MAEGERAARLEAGEVGRREHAEHARALVDDDDVVGAGVEHLDDGVDRDALGPDLTAGRDDQRDGALRRHLAGDDALAQHGVGEDREVVAVADEDRRRVVVGHQLRRAADRHVASQNTGGRLISSATRIVPSSGRAWTTWPVCTMRCRSDAREVAGAGRAG